MRPMLDDGDVDGVAAVAGDGEGATLQSPRLQVLIELVFGDLQGSHAGEHLGGEGERAVFLHRGEEGRQFGIEGGG